MACCLLWLRGYNHCGSHTPTCTKPHSTVGVVWSLTAQCRCYTRGSHYWYRQTGMAPQCHRQSHMHRQTHTVDKPQLTQHSETRNLTLDVRCCGRSRVQRSKVMFKGLIKWDIASLKLRCSEISLFNPLDSILGYVMHNNKIWEKINVFAFLYESVPVELNITSQWPGNEMLKWYSMFPQRCLIISLHLASYVWIENCYYKTGYYCI